MFFNNNLNQDKKLDINKKIVYVNKSDKKIWLIKIKLIKMRIINPIILRFIAIIL